MYKNNARSLVSFALSLAVIFAATAVFYAAKAEKYERNMLLASESALSRLIGSAESMEEQLSTLSRSGGGIALASAAAEIWSASQSAQAALAMLELEDSGAPSCIKLLNQAGEYSRYLMQKAAEGKQMTPDEEQNLKEISQKLSALCNRLRHVKEGFDTGEITAGKARSRSEKAALLSTSLSGLEEEYSPSAPLIYDGGYSDHIPDISPLYTQGMEEATQEKALKVAARFLGKNPSQIKLLYQSEGTLPVYGFECQDSIVEISKQGGMIVTVSTNRNVHANTVSQDEAMEKALQLCEELGYKNLKCRYTSEEANVLTLELVGVSENVTVYPDRVTVRVALDNGEILGLDARRYLMSNTARQLELPLETPDGASLVLLPTDGQNERLCYEYSGDGHLRYVCCESNLCYAVHNFEDGEQDGFIPD